MEELKPKPDNSFKLWAFFFLVLILGSPLIEGGETYHTVIWLRLWVIGFALYYFQAAIGKDKIEIAAPAGNWIILLLWIVLSASLLITHYYYITVYWYSNALAYLLLFYLAINLLAREDGNRKLLAALFFILLAAAMMESILGIAGYFKSHPGRATGSFFNPGYYSGFLLALISFPLSALLYDLWPEWGRRRKFVFRIAMALSLVLIFAGMMVSASRSIVFALIPIGLILLSRFRLKAFLVLILLVLAVALIPNPLRTRLKDLGRDPYAWERITIWKTSLRMIRHHPQGVGLGMYQYYYDRYAYPVRTVKIGRYMKSANRAHNEFIDFAAECSPLALILILAWLAIQLWPALAAMSGRPDPNLKRDHGMLLGFAGSFFGILGHSLVDSNLHQPPIMILAIIDLAGMVYLGSRFRPGILKKSTATIQQPLFLHSFTILAGAMIALVMTYQAVIFGLTLRSGRIAQPEQQINYLVRLSRLPSGYAKLDYQIGIDLRALFYRTENPDFAVQALPYLEFACRLNPENFEYFYQWAFTIYRLSLFMKNPAMLGRAEQVARLSLGRSDHYVFTYLILSDIARLKQEYPQQEKWLNSALEQEPYYFLARFLLINFLIEQDRLDQARTQLQILKAQKKEVDQMPRSSLNGFQTTLTSLSNQEIANLESKLIQKSAPPK